MNYDELSEPARKFLNKKIDILFAEYQRVGKIISEQAEAAFSDIKLFSALAGAGTFVAAGFPGFQFQGKALLIILSAFLVITFSIALRHLIRRAVMDYFQYKQDEVAKELEQALGTKSLRLTEWFSRRELINKMNLIGYLYLILGATVLPMPLVLVELEGWGLNYLPYEISFPRTALLFYCLFLAFSLFAILRQQAIRMIANEEDVQSPYSLALNWPSTIEKKNGDDPTKPEPELVQEESQTGTPSASEGETLADQQPPKEIE